MKSSWKQWTVGFITGLSVGFYSIYVAQCFWNWFGVPYLHIPSISFLQACCLMILIGFFTRRGFPLLLTTETGQMKVITAGIGYCLPDEKREQWEADDSAFNLLTIFALIFDGFALNTLLLLTEYLVHKAMIA